MTHDGIIVLGAPRSGTTLLRRIMDGHPNISAPGETYILSACARFLAEEPVVDGMDIGVINGLGFLDVPEEELLSRLRDFAFGFRREHAAREGKSRWLEKTAIDAFHVADIDRLCGNDAHFICVVRHGLDVACSMLDWSVKAQSFPPELHEYVKDTPRLLEAFATAWAKVTTDIWDFAEAHPDNTVILRYEDLTADPVKEMARVFTSIGEDFAPEMLEEALAARDPKGFSDWKAFSQKDVNAASVARWSSLSPDTVAMLADIVNPVLERTGYEPVPSGPARSRAAQRKRYNTGLILQSLR